MQREIVSRRNAEGCHPFHDGEVGNSQPVALPDVAATAGVRPGPRSWLVRVAVDPIGTPRTTDDGRPVASAAEEDAMSLRLGADDTG
jgi:hypothetical protein